MLAAAALTTTVHVVELSVARHVDPGSFPGYARIFDFQWPSLLYAVDIVAWDVFFGLALLCAVPAFRRRSDTAVRLGLIASGSLCLLGLIGPLTNAIGWRAIGIFGYTLVFAATCVPLARAFRSDADGERPAGKTPAVVVGGMSTQGERGIDRRGPASHPATRQGQRARAGHAGTP
jgi:hypothetical protein